MVEDVAKIITTDIVSNWSRSFRENLLYFSIRKLNCPYRLRSLTNRIKIKKIFVDYLSYTQFLISLVPIVQEFGFVTRVTRRVPHVEQELSRFVLLYLSFFLAMSCIPLLILVSFNLRLLITPLVSSNFSFTEDYILYVSSQKFELPRCLHGCNNMRCLFYHFCNGSF